VEIPGKFSGKPAFTARRYRKAQKLDPVLEYVAGACGPKYYFEEGEIAVRQPIAVQLNEVFSSRSETDFLGGGIMTRKLLRFCVLGLLVVATAHAHAAIVPVPTGLQPGDKYYLAFLTSGTISGTSANIVDYNAFAQSQANTAQSLSGFTWKAAVSTPTVNALTNLNIGNFPIYRIDGVQIATGSSDLWDGSLLAAINVDQNETVYGGGVLAWTGGQQNGTAYPGSQLSTAAPIVGGVSSTSSTWMVVNASNSANTNRVYAFSNELIVPVPEPASISIAACGVALGGLAVARRRWAAKSA
jgi:hypothetical protein